MKELKNVRGFLGQGLVAADMVSARSKQPHSFVEKKLSNVSVKKDRSKALKNNLMRNDSSKPFRRLSVMFFGKF